MLVCFVTGLVMVGLFGLFRYGGFVVGFGYLCYCVYCWFISVCCFAVWGGFSWLCLIGWLVLFVVAWMSFIGYLGPACWIMLLFGWFSAGFGCEIVGICLCCCIVFCLCCWMVFVRL